ncbi:DUF2202 domain-containing protein [Desulfurobacterium atlanticum]|uniref:DUF2202 domain-containing protein n=1 Tax=Desulfurobacterium atlanticum TaxID=240169 RepID=A0A238Y377_9BACT|nr:DUF2202 domain-containing protein [Desulfurobacterium atlanticum]SNR65103.1 hypothetical protein SAMN06265340_10246 [Desulfurobacterium atlanticum]
MKKVLTGIIGSLIVAGGLTSYSAAANKTVSTMPGRGPAYISTLSKEPLSVREKRDLLFMREEEKLARDVYQSLYEMWNIPVFRNIAKSEQRHMDMIKLLIDKYGLQDPVEITGDKRGVFKNKRLQSLYRKLVKKGSKSLIDALEVGATIEDLDIKDLHEALKDTDNQDIRAVYQNLMKGSRNHMRAFTRILRRYGIEYKPQYISEKEYLSIVNSKHEIGVVYSGNGKAVNPFQIITLEGKIIKVYQRKGYGNRKVVWWAAKVKTDSGNIEVAIAPVWLYSSIDLKIGEKVTVTGYVPPFWRINNINGIMACTIETEKGVKYNLRDCNRFNKRLRFNR